MMRKKTNRLGVIAVAAGALVSGACSDATSPETLDDALLEDVAVVAADATLEDIAIMRTPFTFGGAALGVDGISDWFEGTRSRTFFDENGEAQAAYDPLTTASIHIEMEISREVSREYWSASIHRTRSMTVSGLLGEETVREWDGTGAEEVFRSRHLEDGTVRSHEMEGTFEKTDVMVPVPGTSDTPWPISGTIHRTVHVTVENGPDGDFERTVEVTITFDGDSTATAVVNGETFEIDLTTRTGGFPLRHRRFHHG